MIFVDCGKGHTFNQSDTIPILSLHPSYKVNKKSGLKEQSRVTKSEEGSVEVTYLKADKARYLRIEVCSEFSLFQSK
jgi:hypothetical protein